MSRLNDATPEEWDGVNAPSIPKKVYYGGQEVEYPVRAYSGTAPVTQEDLDQLFADGSFTSPEGYDTYEEYMAKKDLYDEQRMNIIGQNGNDGLHYDHDSYWGGLESPKDKQVEGSHYKDRAIQPIDYIIQNGLSFCEGNVVKYVTRHKEKNGKKDIQKAIHYLEFILESEYD